MLKVQNVPFRIKRAPLLWPDLRGARHICHYNLDNLPFEHNFHGIIPENMNKVKELCAILNSTLIAFLLEVFTRTSLGGGAARLLTSDLKKLPVPDLNYFDSNQQNLLIDAFERLSQCIIRSIFDELGFALCPFKRGCQHPEHPYEHVQPETLTLEQVKEASPDRFELDSVVFDVLGLTDDERLEVYKAVAQLVKDRLLKAKSVKKQLT